MNTRSRSWAFTVNNYSQEDVERLEEVAHQLSAYCCYAKEVAPTTKTEHLQAYVHFENAKTFKKLQKILPKGSHIEVAKGNALENRTYIKGPWEKDGKIKEINETFKEFGTMPSQGKRNDILEVKEEILSGSGMKEIIEIASNYQTLKVAEMLLKYKERKRNWKPEVVWFYGKSGSGKTKTVYELAPEVYRKTNSTGKWWEGYDAHPDVLLDDIKDTSKEMYSTLLELLDRYDCRVETKGGSRQFLAKRIYITSILHPRDLYGHIDADIKELARRIDNIKEVV